MKKYVEHKVFSEELELWFYLQTLKGIKLGIPDGYYCVEFTDSVEGLRFRMMLRFSERKVLNRVLYTRPMDPRFYFYVSNDEVFCIGLESRNFVAHDEVDEGKWQLMGFRDQLSPTEGPEFHFTPEQYEAACEKLMEALVMNAKKVA